MVRVPSISFLASVKRSGAAWVGASSQTQLRGIESGFPPKPLSIIRLQARRSLEVFMQMAKWLRRPFWVVRGVFHFVRSSEANDSRKSRL